MLIKHSKLKNTGILFELLVRQITTDTLSGKNSEAVDILKKYFGKTELGREYKLYDSLLKHTNLTEGKAEIIISTVLENAKNLNRSVLKRQKYNLIKEIKEHYDLDVFFKTKLPNYKIQASIYTLIESTFKGNDLSLEQIINNKISILEHLTSSSKSLLEENKNNSIIDEFINYDKDIRILSYKLILEKFNKKYSNFGDDQKQILQEFIYSIDNTPKLKNFYNTKIDEIKTNILNLNENTNDITTKIKIDEISKLLIPLNKQDKVTNEHMVNLLQYCDLISELKKTNGK